MAQVLHLKILFILRQVSHHPMIVACHCEGKGWKFWGDTNLKSKFSGRSIQLDPVGVLTLEFDDGEIYQWSKVCDHEYLYEKCSLLGSSWMLHSLLQVTTSIYNLILGKLYCDHYGTMRIQGNREYSCKLKFKEQSLIDRNPHQVLIHHVNLEALTNFSYEGYSRMSFSLLLNHCWCSCWRKWPELGVHILLPMIIPRYLYMPSMPILDGYDTLSLMLVLDTPLIFLGYKFSIFYYIESIISYSPIVFITFQHKKMSERNTKNDNFINLEMSWRRKSILHIKVFT